MLTMCKELPCVRADLLDGMDMKTTKHARYLEVVIIHRERRHAPYNCLSFVLLSLLEQFGRLGPAQNPLGGCIFSHHTQKATDQTSNTTEQRDFEEAVIA
jgi:hypothetical protein